MVKTQIIMKSLKDKKCIKCGITKPIDSFFVDRRLKDGHFGRCKECCKLWVQSKEVKARRVKQSSGYMKRSKELLTDNYIVRQICHHNELTPDEVRKYPELIEAKRQLIIINRIIKHEKDKKRKGLEG